MVFKRNSRTNNVQQNWEQGRNDAVNIFGDEAEDEPEIGLSGNGRRRGRSLRARKQERERAGWILLQRRKIKFNGSEREEIQFFEIELCFGFAFGFFGFADHFAKFAGMFSVESFGQGSAQGAVLRIVDRHADPCRRLQNRPMSTQRENQGGHDEPFFRTREHGWKNKHRWEENKSIQAVGLAHYSIALTETWRHF